MKTREELIELLSEVVWAGEYGEGSTGDTLFNLNAVQEKILEGVPEIKQEVEEHYLEMEKDMGELMQRRWETQEEFCERQRKLDELYDKIARQDEENE